MLKRIVFILALACAPAFAQTYTSTALQNSSGNYARVVPYAPVTVCASSDLASPCTTKVTTYTDQTLSVACTLSANAVGAPSSGAGCNNPGAADANGNFSVFLPAGTYRICTYAQNYQCQTFTSPSVAAAGLADPGGNGVVKRTSLNTTAIATSSDIISLWGGSCSISTFLRGDGTCAAPSAGLADPGSNGLLKRTALNTTAIAASADVIALFSGCSGTLYLGADGACHSVGSSSFSGITSGTNTTAAMVAGSGSSLVPSGTGQITGITNWFSIAPTAIQPSMPSLAFAVGGGTIGNSTVYVKLTFAGQSTVVPSGEAKITNSGCSSNCTVTVTMPAECTSPVAPTTGCTVWDSLTTNTEKQQAASAACVNITSATCVISTIAAGSTLSTPATTGTNPPNLQSNPNTPDSIIPSLFAQKSDNNFYPIAGVDVSGLNALPLPKGTFTWFDRFFINDTNGPPIISNTLVSIHHQSGNTTGTGSTVDDRALGVEMIDTNTPSPNYEQFLTQYNEAQVFNNNFSCAPVGGEVCAAGLRARAQDNRSAGVNNAQFAGVVGVASTNVTTPKIGSCSPCIVGVAGRAAQEGVSGQNAGGAIYAGVQGQADATGSNTNGNGVSFYATPPSIKFVGNAGFLSNVAYYVPSSANWDFGFASNATAKNYFRGPVNLDSIGAQNAGTITIGGSIQPRAVSTAQLPTSPNISSISNIGAGGSTNYQYKAVWKDVNGATSAVSGVTQTNTGNATLNGSNFNRLTLFNTTQVTTCPTSIDIYRTVSAGTPSSTGKIGSFTVAECSTVNNGNPTFDDTGLAGDSTTPPTVNTTGSIQATGFNRGTLNTVQVASNFTTAANTNLQTITGLSWTIPTNAANYSFHCSLAYSQATGLAAVAFGIQAATTAPTNIFAKGREQITVGPPATYVSGVLATLTTTTATNIVSGTPGANATNYEADLDGTIQEPANGGGNTINIMVSTATAGDAVTVLQGSYCQLF